jgi:hypothetical protein
MARCGGKGHMKGADAMTTMGGRYARRTGGFVLAAALVSSPLRERMMPACDNASRLA